MKTLINLAHRCSTMVANHFASIDARNFAEMSAATLLLNLSPPLLIRQEPSHPGNQCRESAHDLDWRKYGGAFRQCVSSHL